MSCQYTYDLEVILMKPRFVGRFDHEKKTCEFEIDDVTKENVGPCVTRLKAFLRDCKEATLFSAPAAKLEARLCS